MSFSSKTYNPSSEDKPMSQPNTKFKEKDDMVGLNDKFVSLIDRVKNLENEKKMLDKKLELLKGQEDYNGNVDDIVRKLENDLEQKIDNLIHEQKKLKDELARMQKEKDDNKKRYEDEMGKRAEVESDFVITKKKLDQNYSDLVKDALELERLNRKLGFFRDAFDEEIKELESMIKNDSVILSENSKRSLDMEDIVKNVQAQYASLANRAREEAEQWNQKKMDDMVQSAGQREQEARDIKRELSDLQRIIQRLKADLDGLKKKEDALKDEIDNARKEGEENIQSAQTDIKLVQEALNNCKQELAVQVRHHQELLNLKLALDIEIRTYQKLLEGEEKRINQYMRNSDF